MSAAKKILYITPGFPVDEDDTACIPALQEFFGELAARQNQQPIVSLHYPGKSNYLWNGHPVTAFGWNNPKRLRKLTILNSGIKTLKQIAEQELPDLIHSFWMTDAGLLGGQLARHLGIPHVVTVMGQDVETGYYFDRILKGKPSVVTLTADQDKLLQKHYQNTTVIPWGLSDTLGEPSSDKEFDIITVGSLIDVKRPYQTLELVSMLKETHPNIQAVLVGEGPLRSELQGRIESMALEGNVKLLGEVSRVQTIELVSKSRVLFHPSRYEGFGMVVIEALACGVPVVSYPTGVASTLAEVRKIGQLADAVEVVKDILVSASGMSISKPYRIEDTVDAYLNLYETLI